MRFVDELKRRKVGRVVLAYAAAAFVVLQVADIALPPLGVPDWVMAAIVVLTALGFPVAVALAWAFDLTAGGIVRTPTAESRAQSTGSNGSRLARRRAMVLVGTTALVSVAAGGLYATVRYVPDPALDQNLVAVTPFRVTGDPALEYLREGMVDLLAATLTGEGGPRAADPRIVLSAVERIAGRENADLGSDSARLVARSIGAGRALFGSVIALPGEIQINATLVRVSGTERTIEASARGAPDRLTSLIDQITAQLLAVDAGETEQRLATLTTTSLPALRAYLAGQAAYRRSRFGEAAEHFDDAVVQDSTFALAALLLNTMIGWGEVPTPNQPRAGRLAWENRDRLSPLDRVFLVARFGETYPSQRTISQQLASWEHALTELRDRADALFHYGDVMMHRGAVADRQEFVEDSKRIFSRTLQVDSSYMPALTHLLDIAMYQRDTAATRNLFMLLEQRDTTPASARYQYLVRSLFVRDSTTRQDIIANMDTLAADDLYFLTVGIGWFVPTHVAQQAAQVSLERALTPAQRDAALLGAYNVALNAGRPAEAASYAREALRGSAANERIWHARLLGDALFWDGEVSLAARSAERIEALLADTAPDGGLAGAACVAGVWWAVQLDLQLAERAAAAADAGVEGTHTVHALCAPVIRALIAHESKAADAATRLAHADSLAALGPSGDAALRRVLNFALARLHETRGSIEDARRAVRRRTADIDMYMQYSTFLREEARLSELLGDDAAAIDAWRRYLDLRPDPEPSIAQQMADAAAALARLTGESR